MLAFPLELRGPSELIDSDTDEEGSNTPRPEDREDNRIGYSATDPWTTMRTLAGDPPFALSDNPLLRPVEFQALFLARHHEPPMPTDVCRLFNMIPSSHLRRSSEDGSRYFGVGAN